MSAQSTTLETPWIIVIVFGIVISAQAMYIWLRHVRDKGMPTLSRGGGRPRTEYYDLSRQRAPRDDRRAVMHTGYSPQVPPPIMGGRW